MLTEWRRDELCGRLWRAAVRSAPLKTLLLYLRNTVLIWFASYHSWTSLLAVLLHGPLLLLFFRSRFGFPGIPPAARSFLLLVVGYFVFFHAAVYPHVRFVTPIVPLLGVMVMPLLTGWRERRKRGRPEGVRPGLS